MEERLKALRTDIARTEATYERVKTQDEHDLILTQISSLAINIIRACASSMTLSAVLFLLLELHHPLASLCLQTRNMTAEEEMRVAEQRRALRAAMEELSNIEQTMTHVPFDSIYTCLCVTLPIQDIVASNFLLSLTHSVCMALF